MDENKEGYQEFEMSADDIFELEIGFAIVNLMMFEDKSYDDARKEAIQEWKEIKQIEKGN